MAQKVILVADPGIDTAFAVALALHDPTMDVIGLVASAGNITADRATQNVHLLINAMDPPKWPRLGAALSVQYELDGTRLHGRDGLGNIELPPVTLHSPTAGDKAIVELIREYPHDVTLVVLGPATVVAAAFDRDPELSVLVDRVILMGGAWRVPGNATATAEFHFYCDPESARRVLRSGTSVTLIPLDAARKLVFSPTDLLELPNPESATNTFLRRIVPFGIRASSNLYGIEGFHLKDVLGIAAVAQPGKFTLERVYVDVETRGELTRGMSVFDTRPSPAGVPNADVATGVDIVGVRDYIREILTHAR
ncbi:MAG TPA: nucleoside hydrolase [Gemmataceae bacterium]|jgi:inosine-uridine nucleoside N-ribohydrolase|nr:nucleoside hydrolase [Gemmataceae bacterium]